ncbi:MAG: hypothetical protein HY513_03585 [Candidatus Aenigmarchaeota archaeon]|nr:hypothetical protein [Candidatus Aenigmarchaeota archaeon]
MDNEDRRLGASNHKKILFLEKEIDKIKHLHKLGKLETKEARKQIKMYEAVLAELVAGMPQYYKEIYSMKKEHGVA